MTFDGFPDRAFAWLRGIEADNSRAYFQRTRDVYEHDVRGALTALLDALSSEFPGDMKVFRQQRDVRFSPDKSPYKTRTYGGIRGAGAVGWYAEVSAERLFAGAGAHGFAPDQLQRYRAAVLDDEAGSALDGIVADLEAGGVEVFGATLKTAPRGVPHDHPRARLLRHKALFCGRSLPAGPDGIPRDAALDHVRGTWRAAGALGGWLDGHVGAEGR